MDPLDDLCPKPDQPPPSETSPLVAPLQQSAVYRCESLAQVNSLANKKENGFIYSRDAHPNAQALAEKLRLMHGAEFGVVCSSGMAAIASICIAQLTVGDRIAVHKTLYGRSHELFLQELPRYGIEVHWLDLHQANLGDLKLPDKTKLVFTETITNPLLKVSPVSELATWAHQQGAKLFIDNTFAGPALCRPLALGADWVMESLTKLLNGHSDVLLGAILGTSSNQDRIQQVLTRWGWATSPHDCWLASRGLTTYALRAERSFQNAAQLAHWLSQQEDIIEKLFYPGLEGKSDREVGKKIFQNISKLSNTKVAPYGSMLSFELKGGRENVEALIKALPSIPFSPSLGDVCTTLSHPASTSHRGLTEAERLERGIHQGLVRISVGIESIGSLISQFDQAFQTLRNT
ncbi:Aminotransferase class I/II-fold pyridoxal phosphate-dependent enzyme [Planctomycetales bacterium 10988]|nr:Aminotransferase class I/II-fold pyridoxal phosphate-dependent enzyme [Planctomycetales bacterium 10988]